MAWESENAGIESPGTFKPHREPSVDADRGGVIDLAGDIDLRADSGAFAALDAGQDAALEAELEREWLRRESEAAASAVAPPPVWIAPPPRPTALAMLGRAVLRLQLYRGWKQIDVERRTGIDQTTISRLERGERRGLSVRRLAMILDALLVGDISFEPFLPEGPPTALELMLGGDRWERAGRAADRRLRRPGRTRTTISTRPLPETPREGPNAAI